MSPAPSRTIRFHEYGQPPDVLCEERVEVADPPAGRVRVRVTAAGLNPADWELCRGFMAGSLPRGIGCDVSGRVDAVGENVDDIAAGDLVFGSADFLGQPSAGVADAAILRSWYRVPDGLDPVEAAVLPMVVQTARWTLDAMGLGSGATLFVNGAGAMVGFAAVQIALRRGARVIASAGSAFAAELTALGALVTPYGDGMAQRVRDLAPGPVDLVLDAAPPKAGSIAEFIAIAGEPHRVMTVSNHDEARRHGARVNLDYRGPVAPGVTFLPEYASLAADGSFRIPIARTYPLGEWREAVKLSMSGHPHGKVVLLPEAIGTS